jgi:predicted acetyltransferase
MDIDLRPVTPEEWPEWVRADGAAFGYVPSDEHIERTRGIFPLDRSIGAFDRGRIVGTAASFPFEMTVPGLASAPTAGVTWVAVLPTHRRRGVLRSMMDRQLDDVAARGEPLAILTASEGAIYGRFGYGRASFHAEYRIDPRQARLRDRPDAGGRVDLVSREEAAEVGPGVFERARRGLVGDHSLDAEHWRTFFEDWEDRRHGASPRFYALYRSASGAVDGLAAYRRTMSWDRGVPTGTAIVDPMPAVTNEAYAALCAFLLGLDLVTEVRLLSRSVDEPLRWMLVDSRQLVAASVTDDIWARIVDIPAAFSLRRYPVAGRLVVEVTDPFRPANDGRYLIEGDCGGASCTRTSEPADLALSAAELGSVYLGGVRPSVLARAGLVDELTPGALARADAFLAAESTPWCQTGF